MFRERREKRETWVWESNIDQLPLVCPLLEMEPKPGNVPVWESNQQPFSAGADAQPTEPYWSGRFYDFFLPPH